LAKMAESPAASERASALLALVSLAAAVLALALNLVLRIGAFALALVGLLGCVTACWYVVSRRGVVRVLGVVAALIGLAALITGLVLAVISVWLVLAMVALALISVLSARYALRRTPKALRARDHAATRPRPDRPPSGGGPEGAGTGGGQRRQREAECVLIMNLRSGGGKAERFHLSDECAARGIEPVVLRPGDDLASLARDAVASGARAIGMAGGDGSQAIVAAVAANAGIAHVCVPAGTRNHFALDLGLDRADVAGALDAYADQIERRVDLAFVNGHPFVNNCSLGLYARVVQSPQYRDAKLKTAADMLPDLIGPDAEPLDLRFAGPAGDSFTTAHLILVSNDPYQLAHPGGRGTRMRLDLGLLGIVAVQVADAAEARRFMLLELGGRVQRFGGWQEWTGSTFSVDSGGPVEVGVDGEAMVLEPPLRFESRPAALRVWLPRRAVRVSPAARAVRLLTRSTAADLASVAAGSSPAR
jgi:diacylglycerol kinase family enzyme